ncbi:MAG TPA: glycosyltransferase [Solirubrobacteraceae bacterium]|nr:glycosyltransferase [Solirubrobacteraceae bacterium]
MRALVVSNMLPDAAHPERGRFVRDQVAALCGLDGLEVELYEFAPGARALAGAARDLRRRFAPEATLRRRNPPGFDVVHAHFGLTAWPALAVPARVRALTVHGTDVRHPRTRLATAAALPFVDLLAAVSASLAAELPTRAARRRAQVLPCGVDVERFHPIPRAYARSELGLAADGPYVLFAADPARPEKRHDRALALAGAAGAQLLTLGAVEPERVPLWVNAANAVLVPSEREGFGLAVLEALACDVPVLATPVGIHGEALAHVAGTLCAPFELARWHTALAPHLSEADPRIEGRASASRFSAHEMAARVADAWRASLSQAAVHPASTRPA